jgi:hypothetical protein
VKTALRGSVLSAPDKRGKQVVSALVAAVWALRHQHLPAGTELLLDYGKSFWKPKWVADEHCASCFSRDSSDPRNPLVQCHGDSVKGICSVSRHRLCFPLEQQPRMDELGDPNVCYYCPEHLAAALEPPHERRAALILADPWTPPPAVRLPATAAAAQAAVSSAPSVAGCIIPDIYTPPPLGTFIAAAPRATAPAAAMRSISFDDPPIRAAAAASSSARSAITRNSTTDASSFSNQHLSTNSKPLQPVAEESSDDESWQLSDKQSRSDSSSSSSSSSTCSDGSGGGARARVSFAAGSLIRGSAHRVQASAAISVEEDAEAASVMAARKKAGSDPTRARAPFSIRTVAQAVQLPLYAENHGAFSAAQIQRLQRELHAYAERKPRAPWFIPVRRKDRLEVVAPGAAAPQRSVSALSVGTSKSSAASGPVAMELVDVQSVRGGSVVGVDAAARAAPSACAAKTTKITSQRWRDVGSDHLAHDWAEYRACCGQCVVDPASLSMQNRDEHSAHSIVKMFKARLAYRARSVNKDAFTQMVQTTLLEAAQNKVPWMGGSICLSCFRAVLGVSRGWMFETARMPGAGIRAEFPDLNASGSLRKHRAAPQRDRVVRLLRDYIFSVGQRQPNPKGKDISKVRLFLPHRLLAELADALSTHEMHASKLTEPVDVPLHALKEAKAWLEKHENIVLSLGSSIQLMRCATCDRIDNKLTAAYIKEHNRTPDQVNKDRIRKQIHLQTMEKQRKHFMDQKDAAMRDPSECWTVTLDGMDQSKTQLPSRVRYSKDLEPLVRLKVHAIGGFCFGGPQPIIGLLNFPDLRKDSSLSVVTLDRILDIQWERLVELQQLKERAAAVKAASRAAAALLDPMLDQEMRDEAAAAATVHGDERYTEGVGMQWPKLLHVTFDNAGGECKNQWMFRYLGLLVLHGVLHQITVSTLLVGHTHDIVDQLFSIWARVLKIHNAETYEKMRKLFRERYTSRIEGLVQLMRGRQDALEQLSEEERAAFLEQQETSFGDWQSEAANIVQDFSTFVKQTFQNELTPHIELQSVSIDVKGWLSRTMVRELPPLENIDQPHNFGIEKDEQGRVWLYNKHLVDSTVRTNEAVKVTHSYPLTGTGSWTTRALLYDSDAGQHADPFRMPPLGIDTNKLRSTVLKYKEHDAMTVDELVEFNDMLDRLDAAQVTQATVCAECAALCGSYSRHGVVHSSKKADAAAKAESRKQSTSRQKAWDAMVAHLYDPAYADAHNAGQVHSGWWTKWLARVREHILPSYITRGYRSDPRLLAEPFHHHPLKLVSNEGEPPCVAEPARVDVSWLWKHGVPRAGQMAAVRGNSLREPLWVAEIVSVRALTEGARLELQRQQAEEHAEEAMEVDDGAAAAASPPAAAAAAAAAAARAAVPIWRPARSAEAERRGDAAVPLRLKELELTVIYYDVCPRDFVRIHLSLEGDSPAEANKKDAWWAALCQQHGQSEEALTDELRAAVEAEQKPPPSPAWITDLYAKAAFIPSANQLRARRKKQEVTTNIASGAMLIVWGNLEFLFKRGHKTAGLQSWVFRSHAWRYVREDLTEQMAAPKTARPAAAAAAAQGAAQRSSSSDSENEYRDEEKKEQRPGSSLARPAAAANVQPRPQRVCAQKTAMRYDEDADVEADMSFSPSSASSSSNHASDDELAPPPHASHAHERRVRSAPPPRRRKAPGAPQSKRRKT